MVGLGTFGLFRLADNKLNTFLAKQNEKKYNVKEISFNVNNRFLAPNEETLFD